MRELYSKLFQRRGAVGDLKREIEAHIELRADENIAAGMPGPEARAEARRHFGNVVLTRELAREAWQFPRIESVFQDLQYGFRGIRRSPGFSLALILTLALGIGATTAIFSVVYNVLLRPLPYPAGERLVTVGEVAGHANGISVTWINFQHWRAENHTFEDMSAQSYNDFTMTGRGDAQLTHAVLVTPSFFRLTGARAQLGRVFAENDDQVGAPAVVVLSWEFWSKSFGGDPAAIGSALALNGKPCEVIGVLSPAVRVITGRADYYLPLGQSAGGTTNRAKHGSMGVLGLLKPGVTKAAAVKNINEIMERLALSDPGPEGSHRATAQYLAAAITGDVRQTLMILMGAVGMLLLIACANVAGLLLMRGAARTREIAIRTATGAGRMRVARQLLTENLAISALGGGAGVLLALLSLRGLVALAPKMLPRIAEIALDTPVLCFAAGVTMLTALLAGLAPVFASLRLDITGALKDGAAGSGAAARSQRFRSALVVAEIAVTLVLCFASGQLIRSLVAAQNTNPGFDPHNLLAMELQLPPSAYKTDEQARQFYRTLTGKLRHEPGILDAGLVTCPPGGGGCGDWWYSLLDRPAPARPDVPLTLFQTADETYFHAMKIPLLAGREFGPADHAGRSPVAIVNEEIAKKWWPNVHDAIGKRIKFGGPFMEGNEKEIVGVAGNVSQMGLDGESEPQMYFPYAQEGSHSMTVMLRTQGNPEAAIAAVRRLVRSLDQNLPIQSLVPYEAKLGGSLSRRRFSTLLLSVFAMLAMVLAGIGIYGVLNYWVSVRTREIAVRMALGAAGPKIAGWAGWNAGRLALAGIALGVAGGWSAAVWLRSMVYGVPERSLLTMLYAVLVVMAIAAIAAGLPVWRATRVDVSRNLREA